jgi:hypothetical protein
MRAPQHMSTTASLTAACELTLLLLLLLLHARA